MGTVLKQSFFDRDTVEVARDLLGQTLCRRLPSGEVLRARIVETEAYDGFEDRASHAHRGVTPRNAIMFGPPGYVYIYLCYGVHWLLNITTREKGYPAAVLIRGVEGRIGPGRLTKYMQIDGSLNRQRLSRTGGLWMEADAAAGPDMILSGPRIGIGYAGEKWMAMPWRFRIESKHLPLIK